jgi:hypothetical protein
MNLATARLLKPREQFLLDQVGICMGLQVHGPQHRKEDCPMELGCDSNAGPCDHSHQYFGQDQPKMLTFMDCHGCIISDDEIPGVDLDDIEQAEFPRVEPVLAPPVIDDAIKIPGVDMEEPRNLEPKTLRLQMILTPPKPIHHQSRWKQSNKSQLEKSQCQRGKHQSCNHNQSFVDPVEQGPK